MFAAKTNAIEFHQRAELVHTSDADLARAVLANEPGAFHLLWQRFSPVVSRMLRRALGAGVDVDDLVQEVFLALLKSVHRLREPGALSAFVLSITRHAFRRELRHRRVRAHVPLDIVLHESSAICIRDAAAHHAFVYLGVLVDRLKDRERRAFILRYVECMNAEEVAEALGVSVSTARRCFSRAWKRVAFYADRNPFLSDYLDDSSGVSAALADI